jgi:hypothetical protein
LPGELRPLHIVYANNVICSRGPGPNGISLSSGELANKVIFAGSQPCLRNQPTKTQKQKQKDPRQQGSNEPAWSAILHVYCHISLMGKLNTAHTIPQ